MPNSALVAAAFAHFSIAVMAQGSRPEGSGNQNFK